jgi:hypothetical protein
LRPHASPPRACVAEAAAGALPQVADRFANGFDDPADNEEWFFDPDRAGGYLAEVQQAAAQL